MNVLQMFRAASAHRDVELFASIWVSMCAIFVVGAHVAGGIGSSRMIALSCCLNVSLWRRRIYCSSESCELRTFVLLFVVLRPVTGLLNSTSSVEFFHLLDVLVSGIEVLFVLKMLLFRAETYTDGTWKVLSSRILSIIASGACLVSSGGRLFAILTFVLFYDAPILFWLIPSLFSNQFWTAGLIERHEALKNWKNAEKEAVREYFRSGRAVNPRHIFFLWECMLLHIWKRFNHQSFEQAEERYEYVPKASRVYDVRTHTSTRVELCNTAVEVYIGNGALFIRDLDNGLQEEVTIPKVNGAVRSSQVISSHFKYGYSRFAEVEIPVLALTVLAKRVYGKYSCWAPVVRYDECNRMDFDMILDTPVHLLAMNGLQMGGAFVDGQSLVLCNVRGDQLYEAKGVGNMIHVESSTKQANYRPGPLFSLRADKFLGHNGDVTDLVLHGGIRSRWGRLFTFLSRLDKFEAYRRLSKHVISTLSESVLKWKYGMVVADNIDAVNDGMWRTLLAELCQNERRELRSPFSFVRLSNTAVLETTPTCAVFKKSRNKVVTRYGMSRVFHVEREVERLMGTEGEMTIHSDRQIMSYFGSRKLAGWVNAKLAFEAQVRATGKASCYFRSLDSLEEYCADLSINSSDLFTAGWHLEVWGDMIRAVDDKNNCAYAVTSQDGLLHITPSKLMTDCSASKWNVLEFDDRIVGALPMER